jgi:putative selenium metabolism hydrolase
MGVDPRSRTVTFCQELVRRESLSGEERAVADAVEREMTALGYDEVQRDELGNVVGVVRGARAAPREEPGRVAGPVLFDAHMDVVPATEPERWRFPPFSGERADGRVWGRGATDIKGSLAALVVGVGTLPRRDLAGTVVVAASVGEEKVEGLATTHILRRHPAAAVVICEPTDLKLGLGHKGRASLVVEAAGRAAHTSKPENGINAVYRLVEAVARIRGLPRRTDPALGPGLIELVEISSLPFPGSSMVPFRATARFDRRLVRGETLEGVLGELREALVGLEGLAVRPHRTELSCYTGLVLATQDFHAGWAIAPDSELARRSRQALEGAGLGGDFYHAPYCTNGASTAGELGLPTVIYGAGAIDAAHAVNESVGVDELLAAARGYQALAAALAG